MLDHLRGYVSDHLSARAKGRLLLFWYETLTPRLRRSGLAPLVRNWAMRKYLARPEELDIEVTSACDADCIMCPRRAMRRRQGAMDFDLFKKIVDEAVALGVRGLALNGYGEISVLKNYKDYIGYVRRKSRSIRIVINTNGMRMREEMARFYVESGVNMVNITIDGATAATFEGVRRHLKLSQVEENTRRLIELRNASGKRLPLIRLGIIDMPQTHDEIPMFLEKWKGVADIVGVGGLSSRIESIAVSGTDDDWERTPCWLLWNQMPVLVDGTVALCCDDWDGEYPLGSVADSSIKDLWAKHAERMHYRELHLKAQGSQIPACAMCRQPRLGPWWFDGNAADHLSHVGPKPPAAPGPQPPTSAPKSDGLVVLN